jgi:hypothetical protein
MRFTLFILVFALVTGCTQDDARLQGTWHSNRNATVAAIFQRDSRWTNASPAAIRGFRDMFGFTTITYAKGTMTMNARWQVHTHHYRVVDSGHDFVVIRSDAATYKDHDLRLRFVDGDSAYWIETGGLGSGLEERFDRVEK